jgi:hypothetical protein
VETAENAVKRSDTPKMVFAPRDAQTKTAARRPPFVFRIQAAFSGAGA